MMTKVNELRKALTKRGAKTLIAKRSGLSYQALHLIQRGDSDPNEGTCRLIARALGLPDDHFLEPDTQAEPPTRRRVVIELDIPDEFDLTEERLHRIRIAMVGAGNHIINTIKRIDKTD